MILVLISILTACLSMLAVVSPTAMAPSARFSSGCLILALVLCAAFRSIDVGSDTSTYFSIVRDITDNFSSHSYLEPAYRYVVIILLSFRRRIFPVLVAFCLLFNPYLHCFKPRLLS